MPFCLRDDGLSEVVGFVLILAVIVIALSLYQVYGVPAAGREAEIAHMNHVKDRFVDYKIALDSLWVNDRKGVLLSTAFDLGTGSAATGGSAFSLPILTPAGSGGTISVEEGGANLTITAQKEGGELDPLISDLPLGSLSYRSSNRYWVDQTWTYQGGAIFLSQREMTAVRVGPSIVVAKSADDITLNVALISLEGSGTIAGSGPVRIETRMRQDVPSSPKGPYKEVTLIVEGNDKTVGAWKKAFDEVRVRAWEDYSVKLPSDDGSGKAMLTIQPEGTGDVRLTMYPANYTVTIYNAASLME